jgi:alpha-glucosidase (family GH31 glycosyl hydrolase)
VDWYNYWTNERVKGGQTIRVDAPIDRIPLFVRAGSIVPMGAAVESTHEAQAIEKVMVYPGADASFTLFNDDGKTYAYEQGSGRITELKWNESTRRLTQEGSPAWTGSDSGVVEIVGR